MQMEAPAKFKPLLPDEVQSMSQRAIEERTNHLGQLIFSLFKERRACLMRIPDLQDSYEDAKSMMLAEESGTTERAYAEADAELGRTRSTIKIAGNNIAAISNELGYINHFHSNAWSFTQVLLDTIEIGHSNPRSGRWI